MQFTRYARALRAYGQQCCRIFIFPILYRLHTRAIDLTRHAAFKHYCQQRQARSLVFLNIPKRPSELSEEAYALYCQQRHQQHANFH